MKIHSFHFFDREYNFEIEPIDFKSITLLVGASGVGKSTILKAINSIKNIAKGKSYNGVEWAINFSIDDDIFYWEGKFENTENKLPISVSKDGELEAQANKYIVASEKLSINDINIIDRSGSSLIFKSTQSEIPIKAEQSVIALIPDPLIQKVEKGFRKIVYSDYTNSTDLNISTQLIGEEILSEFKTFDDLRNSNKNLIAKLFWTYKKNKTVFKNIKEDFINVFSQVENLKIEPLEIFKDSALPLYIKATPFIQFREKDVDRWLPVMQMSAGMYRTLIHIIELHLSSDGTIILIDEFENSLGVNCIDELTTEIKGAIDRIQFIITSHHPYIINSISYKNWKIITRRAGKIHSEDAEKYNFGKSKHEAFIQLINLPEFKTGKVK